MKANPSNNSDDDDYKPGFQGEDVVLTFIFGVLLAGVLGVLLLDYRALIGAGIPIEMPFLRRTEVVQPIRPARDNDQVRRYSPQTRVDFGPGGNVSLPGIPGKPDSLLSGSMTFHRAGNGVASAVGLIDAGTFSRFEEFMVSIDNEPRIHTLYLHSPGGSVNDAIEMARLIRNRQVTTVIAKNGYCASSCPLVFSGGIKRKIANPAALGVHQVFTSDTATGTLQQGIANAQAVSADAQNLLIDMGVSSRAWIKAMETPKDRLYLFNQKEIKELKWIRK